MENSLARIIVPSFKITRDSFLRQIGSLTVEDAFAACAAIAEIKITVER